MCRYSWVSCLSFVFTLAAHANAPPSAPSSSFGPKTPDEAVRLWNEGQMAFGEARYKDSAYALQRLIDRYPASKRFLDAHLLLGIDYLRSDLPVKAIPVLKYYIQAIPGSVESHRARLMLGNALIRTKKGPEALLIAEEILRARNVPQEVSLSGILLKSWALMEMNRDKRAERTLAAFHGELRRSRISDKSALKAHSIRVELELKNRSCRRFVSGGVVKEAVVRNQLQQRGLCLLESLTIFRKTFDQKDENWLREATDAMVMAFGKYNSACNRPPRPPGKRTAQELRAYREELSIVLSQDCEATRRKAREIVESWKSKVNDSQSHHLARLSKAVGGT